MKIRCYIKWCNENIGLPDVIDLEIAAKTEEDVRVMATNGVIEKMLSEKVNSPVERYSWERKRK